MDSLTKNYEIAYLISPHVPEEEVFGEAGKITGFIQDAHGVVGKIEEPKKRKLAYPILKQLQAYFGWTTFSAAPENLGDLEKRVKREKQITRFLITEAVRRPVREFRARPDRIRRQAQPSLDAVEAFSPQAPKEEDRVKIEELDKRLEEILGK